MDDKENIPFIEKYRPLVFEDVSGHNTILLSIKNYIKNQNLPNFLFHGPPGVGKTSVALLIARSLYGENNYKDKILELNASHERGIKVIRKQVKDFVNSKGLEFKMDIQKDQKEENEKTEEADDASTATTSAAESIDLPQPQSNRKKKLIILDEMDAMTGIAQSALRRIMEKFNGVAFFILIVNHLNKVLPAIKSRCLDCSFLPLNPKDIQKQIYQIIEKEHLIMEEEKSSSLLDTLIILTKGDMRKIVGILQQIKILYNGIIKLSSLYEICRIPTPQQINQILNSFLTETNTKIQIYEHIESFLSDTGFNLKLVLTYITKEILLNQQIVEKYDYIKLIPGLANLEWNLIKGGTDEIQLGYFIAIFSQCKKMNL